MDPIVIVGAGIGGLTAAIALARRGIVAHVYESARELRAVGAGIWVPSNAAQVLADLGVMDAVAREGIALRAIELCHRRERLQAVDLEDVRARFGWPTISIHRARLQRVLAAHVPSECIHLGVRCVAVTEEGLELEDGRCLAARVVVGADGIHSRVRAFVAPEVELRYSGQTCYRGVARLRLPEPWRCVETWGGRYRFGYSALAQDEVYWFAPMLADADGPDRRGELAELYADFPAPIPEILAATERASILRTDLWELPSLSRWSRGRAVLLGDAAHAMTPNLGQGGAQSIEDAWLLADALASHARPEEAFAVYERRRRPRVERIAGMARRVGRAAHMAEGLGAALRNLAFKMTPACASRSALDDLHRVPFLPAAR